MADTGNTETLLVEIRDELRMLRKDMSPGSRSGPRNRRKVEILLRLSKIAGFCKSKLTLPSGKLLI